MDTTEMNQYLASVETEHNNKARAQKVKQFQL